MRSFLTALQFLTRISVKKYNDLTEEDFGRSVKFFPLVGAVLGAIYAAAAAIFFVALPKAGVILPPHVCAALLLMLMLAATGGIFYDGFMDTMDGIFSGRDREKMLSIMKDSAVGANAVMGFVMLSLLNYGLITDMMPKTLLTALFIMPIISRLAVVWAITDFPYARAQGMGKAFADHANKNSLFKATAITLALVLPWGKLAAFALIVSLACAWLLLRYATRVLGGVTGDVYGFTATLTETATLLAATMGEVLLWEG